MFVRKNGISYKINAEMSYLTACEILGAQDIDVLKSRGDGKYTDIMQEKNKLFLLELYYTDASLSVMEIQYMVYKDGLYYYCFDSDRNVMYRLHSYYAPNVSKLKNLYN